MYDIVSELIEIRTIQLNHFQYNAVRNLVNLLQNAYKCENYIEANHEIHTCKCYSCEYHFYMEVCIFSLS